MKKRSLYPYVLTPTLSQRPWGGRFLDTFNKALPPDVKIGESWETDIQCQVTNGLYKGFSLGDVWNQVGNKDLLGVNAMAKYGNRFPLLIKFIDANEQLSVQVHPDDDQASPSLGKTECWFVISAYEARVLHGFNEVHDEQAVRDAIDAKRVEELLHYEPVEAGDVVFVPAGTVHAIGKNLLIYEVQEYSDITFRVYDYGSERQLHIEEAFQVAHLGPSPLIKANPAQIDAGCTCRVADSHFVLLDIDLDAGAFTNKNLNSVAILTALYEPVVIRYGLGYRNQQKVAPFETAVIPAGVKKFRIEGTGQTLLSYVPGEDDPVLKQWRAANNL